MYMVQRRERLKKRLLHSQLEMIELQSDLLLESVGDDLDAELVSVEDKGERVELDSIEVVEDDEVCSPPSVRQTR